jgi:large subunit ribosomal protein L2
MSKLKNKLKYCNPVTPSLRGTVLLRTSSKNDPLKSLLGPKKSSGGRNNDGRITVRFRGGGNKVRYRVIAFKRTILDIPAEVVKIEYDPNRTASIALIKYENAVHEYIIAPEDLKVGDKIINSESSNELSLRPGNSFALSQIPIGTNVCCIEMKPKSGAAIARSAGSFAQLSGKEFDNAILKMPSGETRVVPAACMAMIGIVSNVQKQNVKLGKAGRRRWRGFRPHVRGETMNPVDHPLGGRTRGGRHPVSPWGQAAKGLKTRRNKSTNVFIISRRKKK